MCAYSLNILSELAVSGLECVWPDCLFPLQHGVRDKTTVMYNSALGVIFGVKKYADALMKVIRKRDITVNFQRKLLEVTKDEAIFENTVEETVESYKVCDATPTHTHPCTHTHTQYDMIHVCPPQGPLEFLKGQPICDETGWVSVDKTTLQNLNYRESHTHTVPSRIYSLCFHGNSKCVWYRRLHQCSL